MACKYKTWRCFIDFQSDQRKNELVMGKIIRCAGMFCIGESFPRRRERPGEKRSAVQEPVSLLLKAVLKPWSLWRPENGGSFRSSFLPLGRQVAQQRPGLCTTTPLLAHTANAGSPVSARRLRPAGERGLRHRPPCPEARQWRVTASTQRPRPQASGDGLAVPLSPSGGRAGSVSPAFFSPPPCQAGGRPRAERLGRSTHPFVAGRPDSAAAWACCGRCQPPARRQRVAEERLSASERASGQLCGVGDSFPRWCCSPSWSLSEVR